MNSCANSVSRLQPKFGEQRQSSQLLSLDSCIATRFAFARNRGALLMASVSRLWLYPLQVRCSPDAFGQYLAS
jgi:hypothetical protein